MHVLENFEKYPIQLLKHHNQPTCDVSSFRMHFGAAACSFFYVDGWLIAFFASAITDGLFFRPPFIGFFWMRLWNRYFTTSSCVLLKKIGRKKGKNKQSSLVMLKRSISRNKKKGKMTICLRITNSKASTFTITFL